MTVDALRLVSDDAVRQDLRVAVSLGLVVNRAIADTPDRAELNFSIFQNALRTFCGNRWLCQFDRTVPRGEIGYWCAN